MICGEKAAAITERSVVFEAILLLKVSPVPGNMAGDICERIFSNSRQSIESAGRGNHFPSTESRWHVFLQRLTGTMLEETSKTRGSPVFKGGCEGV